MLVFFIFQSDFDFHHFLCPDGEWWEGCGVAGCRGLCITGCRCCAAGWFGEYQWGGGEEDIITVSSSSSSSTSSTDTTQEGLPPSYRVALAMGPITVSFASLFVWIIFTLFFFFKYDDITEASSIAAAAHAAALAAAAATDSSDVSFAWLV